MIKALHFVRVSVLCVSSDIGSRASMYVIVSVKALDGLTLKASDKMKGNDLPGAVAAEGLIGKLGNAPLFGRSEPEPPL